jgi:hypothetical protein
MGCPPWTLSLELSVWVVVDASNQCDINLSVSHVSTLLGLAKKQPDDCPVGNSAGSVLYTASISA